MFSPLQSESGPEVPGRVLANESDGFTTVGQGDKGPSDGGRHRCAGPGGSPSVALVAEAEQQAW